MLQLSLFLTPDNIDFNSVKVTDPALNDNVDIMVMIGKENIAHMNHNHHSKRDN